MQEAGLLRHCRIARITLTLVPPHGLSSERMCRPFPGREPVTISVIGSLYGQSETSCEIQQRSTFFLVQSSVVLCGPQQAVSQPAPAPVRPAPQTRGCASAQTCCGAGPAAGRAAGRRGPARRRGVPQRHELRSFSGRPQAAGGGGRRLAARDGRSRPLPRLRPEHRQPRPRPARVRPGVHRIRPQQGVRRCRKKCAGAHPACIRPRSTAPRRNMACRRP